jgi:hypothetical protein
MRAVATLGSETARSTDSATVFVTILPNVLSMEHASALRVVESVEQLYPMLGAEILSLGISVFIASGCKRYWWYIQL